MADLLPLLKKIDSLRVELDFLKPLKQSDDERLWKKFRLEWNYNSNHIEGNTLTYGQTELLLIFDKTTGDHEMREYEEMKAHDVAIKLIQEYAKDSSRALTEADVRELNKIILVRPYWGNAQTPDGQPARKEIIPGEYKKQPNSLRLQNGEMFHYASPEETPAKMAELMEWYRKAESERKFHPLQLAAKIHYDFVRIHPFDASNGRTSRLLMNYVLLRHGFPPVVIKSADKKSYLTALNKADVGDLDSFVEYVGERLVWSLEISIKAAKGKSIEEVDDIDKEIDIFKKERKNNSNAIPKSLELIEIV
jgi:Fic family protein